MSLDKFTSGQDHINTSKPHRYYMCKECGEELFSDYTQRLGKCASCECD